MGRPAPMLRATHAPRAGERRPGMGGLCSAGGQRSGKKARSCSMKLRSLRSLAINTHNCAYLRRCIYLCITVCVYSGDAKTQKGADSGGASHCHLWRPLVYYSRGLPASFQTFSQRPQLSQECPGGNGVPEYSALVNSTQWQIHDPG